MGIHDRNSRGIEKVPGKRGDGVKTEKRQMKQIRLEGTIFMVCFKISYKLRI